MKAQTRLSSAAPSADFTLVELTIIGHRRPAARRPDNGLHNPAWTTHCIKETRQTLATINDTLLGFAVANGACAPAQSGTTGWKRPSIAPTTACSTISSRGGRLALQGPMPGKTGSVWRRDACVFRTVRPSRRPPSPASAVYSTIRRADPVTLVGDGRIESAMRRRICALGDRRPAASRRSRLAGRRQPRSPDGSGQQQWTRRRNAGPVADASDQHELCFLCPLDRRHRGILMDIPRLGSAGDGALFNHDRCRASCPDPRAKLLTSRAKPVVMRGSFGITCCLESNTTRSR